MAISFACANCGKKLKAPDDAVGKSSRCPGCGTVVTCPEPILDAELVDPVAGEPAFAIDPSSLPGPPPLPGGGSSASAPGLSEQARRPCPMCGEMIVVGAAKCRFCGEVFDESIRRAQSRTRRVDEDLSAGDILVALFCGWIGCVAGIVWMIQGKSKGWKMLLISLISWVLGIIFLSFVSQSGGLPR